MTRKKELWMAEAFPASTKGALHKQLGISLDKKIPSGLLRQIIQKEVGSHADHHTITALMKKRSQAAINAQRSRK